MAQRCAARELQLLQLIAVMLQPREHVGQVLLPLRCTEVEGDSLHGLAAGCMPGFAHQGNCLHQVLLAQQHDYADKHLVRQAIQLAWALRKCRTVIMSDHLQCMLIESVRSYGRRMKPW